MIENSSHWNTKTVFPCTGVCIFTSVVANLILATTRSTENYYTKTIADIVRGAATSTVQKKKLFDHNKTDRNLQTGELPSLANNFGSRTPPVCCCSTEYTEEFGTDFLGQRKNQIIVEDRMVEALHHPDLYMMLDLAI